MKVVKKISKISLVLFVLLIGVAVTLPLIYEDEIVAKIKEEVNANINAKFDFEDYNLTLFSSFPEFEMTLDDVYIIGNTPFDSLILANIDQLGLTINLMSVLSGDQIEITNAYVDHPEINLKVLEDGAASWSIAIPDSTAKELNNESGSSFQLRLQSYKINQARVSYEDLSLPMKLELNGLNHSGEGDFTESIFVLSTHTTVDSVALDFDGLPLAKDDEIQLDADLEINLEQMKFTFKENDFKLNQLDLGFDGYVAMLADDIEFDLTYKSKEATFKTLLSLVPSIFKKDFENLITNGKMTFNGFVKGIYNDRELPAFRVDIGVDEGYFKYPDLPETVNNIFINTKIDHPQGRNLDNMTIHVHKFHMDIGENPVDAILHLSTPLTDPNINVAIQSQLNLENIKKAIPLQEGEAYKGLITADVKLKGRMSSIEQKKYDEFNAEGQVIVMGMSYKSPDLPYDVEIKSSTFNFSPQELELANLDARIGESNVEVSGVIDNYLAYALKDQKLHGVFKLNSDYFNLNELMVDIESDEATSPIESDSLAIGIIEIPENIDFELITEFKDLQYDNVNMTNIKGGIHLRDKVAELSNLSMNVLDGKVTMLGDYSTQNPTSPEVNFFFDIQNLDIKKTADAFNTIDRLAPIAKYCNGKYSTGMKFKATLNENMKPKVQTLTGNGNLKTSKVTVKNFEILKKIADIVKMPDLKNKQFQNMNLSYQFKDGKAYVDPFIVKTENIDGTVGGYTSFDQKIKYDVRLMIPSKEFGGKANAILNSDVTLPEKVNAKLSITGTIQKPKILPHFSGLREGESIKDKVVDEIKHQANQTIREETQKLIKQAEEQAIKIKTEAKKLADQVRIEGNEQADNLITEAGNNPLKKAAAKLAADKIRNDSKVKANKIQEEAKTKANKIINDAKTKADKR